MNSVISVVKDFNARPWGRYQAEYPGRSGEEFRENCLVQKLKAGDHVTVDLTGYDLYGPSFIDEAFAGLVRQHHFTYQCLKEQLDIHHDDLPSIAGLAWLRIRKASNVLNDNKPASHF